LVLGILALTVVSRAVGLSNAATPQRSSAGGVVDLNGHPLNPFVATGTANVIFFVATDCPVSNSYAPEIQRICKDYGPRGVGCALIYEDLDLPGLHLEASVRRHLQEYRYDDIPAAIDTSRAIAKRAKASVTPEAVVVDRAGKVRYRGRIDNFYAALGKPRREVTEHDVRDALDAVLAGRSVSKPETEALGCFIADSALLRK
jgi:thiol-disulfide isomerase/thioredoxin